MTRSVAAAWPVAGPWPVAAEPAAQRGRVDTRDRVARAQPPGVSFDRLTPPQVKTTATRPAEIGTAQRAQPQQQVTRPDLSRAAGLGLEPRDAQRERHAVGVSRHGIRDPFRSAG
jgi:hypothetical protein